MHTVSPLCNIGCKIVLLVSVSTMCRWRHMHCIAPRTHLWQDQGGATHHSSESVTCMRLAANQPAPRFTLPDIAGNPIALDLYRGKPLLLSFFRSAACPLCSLRLWYLVNQYPKLQQLGLEVIAVFETSRETTITYAGSLRPGFPLIANPTKTLFQTYGIESSFARVPWGMIKHIPQYWQAWRQRVGGRMTDGAPGMLPADFLLTPDQRIATAHYGADIGDHLPFAQINDFAERYALALLPVTRPKR